MQLSLMVIHDLKYRLLRWSRLHHGASCSQGWPIIFKYQKGELDGSVSAPRIHPAILHSQKIRTVLITMATIADSAQIQLYFPF